jgi:hypothetical protein
VLRQAQHDRQKTVRPEPVEGRSAKGKQVAARVAAWIGATIWIWEKMGHSALSQFISQKPNTPSSLK